MPGNFVYSGILIGAEALIRDCGRPPGPIARAAGLPLEALRNPDMLVAADAVLTFFELAALRCEEPAWGLRLAAGNRMATSIGPLWILLRNASTVEQMWRDFSTNFDLYTGAAVVSFDRGGDGGALYWETVSGHARSEVQMAEYSLAAFCKEIRTYCGSGWQPNAVMFRHAAPADLRHHHALLGHNLHFNQQRNGMLLDEATLAHRLHADVRRNRTSVRAILRHGEAIGDDHLPLQVESIIRDLLPLAPCHLENISLAMGMAPRTLQMQLAHRRTGFQKIKDKVRADLALKYLRDSDLSVGQIADLLGYTDLSAFSRSFRRWHGRSARTARNERRR